MGDVAADWVNDDADVFNCCWCVKGLISNVQREGERERENTKREHHY